jgi:hypothetical protein
LELQAKAFKMQSTTGNSFGIETIMLQLMSLFPTGCRFVPSRASITLATRKQAYAANIISADLKAQRLW